MIPLFRFEPHQAADELRMDAHRDSSPRDFFHHRQRKFAGRAKNFYADRLDELVRFLGPFIRALQLLVERVRAGQDAHDGNLCGILIFVRELDERVRFVGLSYRNAIAIILAKIDLLHK